MQGKQKTQPRNVKRSELWPHVKFSLDSEPAFLFILTPPFSGSTVLAKILNTSSRSMILKERAEGQCLIPGMFSADRWNPDKYIDWESVRSVWLSKYQEVNAYVETLNLIIEKSPANLVRAEQLRHHFPNSKFFAFNRNPYASCSSSFHRGHSDKNLSQDARLNIFRKLARKWIVRSSFIKKVIEDWSIPYFSYEQFCDETEMCIQKVIDICPEISDINIQAKVKVKDYDRQSIVDQNERQIKLLHPEDISAIFSEISGESDILDFFKYNAHYCIQK